MARTKRRVRVNGRFYVTMLLAVLVIIALVLVIPKSGSTSLRSGSMNAVFEKQAVVIREESCISVEQFDRVDYQVNEGAVVNAEMPVATVYKWGYSDDMAQSLITIQQKIYEKQLSILDGIASTELVSVNAQINDMKQAIKDCVSGDSQEDLLTLERNLKGLLSQRSELLKNSVQPDVELTSLYSEESAKLSQIAEYSSTVSAKMTGVVSFYFDGYEQVLTADKLDVLNADLISNVIKGASSDAVNSSESMLYRLVNSNHWYIAFVSPINGARLVAGQTYSVTFDGIHDRVFVGQARDAVVYGSGVLNIMEFNEDIGELLSARTVNATITASMSGYEVPIEAVKVKDGESVLTTNSGNIPVTVIAEDGETALVTGSSLRDGLKFKK